MAKSGSHPSLETLSALADGELAAAALREADGHVDSCPPCRGTLSGLRGAASLVRGLSRRPLPAGFLRRLEDRRRREAARELGWPSLALAFSVLLIFVIGYNAGGPGGRAAPLVAGSGAPAAPAAPAAHQDAASLRAAGLRQAPVTGRARRTYSNEELHRFLQGETERLGIEAIIGPGGEDLPERALQPAPDNLSQQQAQEYMRKLQQLRGMFGIPEPSLVPISGRRAELIGGVKPRHGVPLAQSAPNPGQEPRRWSGPYSGGNEAGTRTVSDSASWRRLWGDLSREPAPGIDFDRRQVVAVFAGERPSGGYSVDVSEVLMTESFLVVRYREGAPAPGAAAPDGRTAPYVMLEVPKTDLPVRFEKIAEDR